MRINYLTLLSTRNIASANNIPLDHTGYYHNLLMTTDGLIMLHVTSATNPVSKMRLLATFCGLKQSQLHCPAGTSV